MKEKSCASVGFFSLKWDYFYKNGRYKYNNQCRLLNFFDSEKKIEKKLKKILVSLFTFLSVSTIIYSIRDRSEAQ